MGWLVMSRPNCLLKINVIAQTTTKFNTIEKKVS